MNIESYYRKYPILVKRLSTNKDFKYRYYKNPEARVTLVLLTGGIGLSDLFYLHFERFTKDFSVITFDYQTQFSNHTEFAGAVAELLQTLNEKVWLVGQSLGGIVAQIIARSHPGAVNGLVLSNTCSLAEDMGDEAYTQLMEMIKRQKKAKKTLSFIPFPLYKHFVKYAVMKKRVNGFTDQEKALMESLCNTMLKLLTKQYEYHMIDFLVDIQNHFGMTPKDFQHWNDKVLLILSEDDATFNQACKDSLTAIMPNPTVITDITGGHLALIIKLDKYTDTVTNYILSRT